MKVKTTDGVLTRDILEWHVPEEVLAVLLKDRSTGRNLIWAMDDYARRGAGFGAEDQITVAQLTSKKDPVIRPRVDKNAEEQRQRSVKRAEVFTPSWICNKQNNLVEFAEIISWNIWQMDGIKYVVPMSCKPKVTKETLLDGTVETHVEECPGCSKKGNRQHFGTYCKVMDWNTGEPVEFRAIAENGGGHG